MSGFVRVGLVVVVGWVAGCGGGAGGADETFMRFRTDGRDFEAGSAELLVQSLDEPGRYFVSLNPVGLEEPSLSAHFHMRLENPSAVSGRTADFASVPDDMMIPVVSLELGDDVVATPDHPYTFVIRFGEIEEGFVEGSLSGTGFTVWKLGTEGERPTDVSGTFRARLVER